MLSILLLLSNLSFFNCHYVQKWFTNATCDKTSQDKMPTISTSLLKSSCMFSWTLWFLLILLWGAFQRFNRQETWREVMAEKEPVVGAEPEPLQQVRNLYKGEDAQAAEPLLHIWTRLKRTWHVQVKNNVTDYDFDPSGNWPPIKIWISSENLPGL